MNKVDRPMAENPSPSPHDDIFAYLAAQEARIEALEAARAAQEALKMTIRKRWMQCAQAGLEALRKDYAEAH